MDVLEAIRRRASTRAYLDKPVDRATIESILEAARWAPSGTNAQPWQVVVVTGETKRKVERGAAGGTPGRPPGKSRLFLLPETLGRTLQVAAHRLRAGALPGNENRARRQGRAPQGLEQQLFLSSARRWGCCSFSTAALEKGSWVDMGMFIENVMLAALGIGLATCPQAAIAEYPDIVRRLVNVPDSAPSSAAWRSATRQRRAREQLSHRARAGGGLHRLA